MSRVIVGVLLALVIAAGVFVYFVASRGRSSPPSWATGSGSTARATRRAANTRHRRSAPARTDRRTKASAGGAPRGDRGASGRSGGSASRSGSGAGSGAAAPSARRKANDRADLLRVIRKGGGSEEDRPKGKLTAKAIKSAIRAVVPRVRDCYQKRLATNPQLAGKVVASFVIVAKDGQGHIAEGEIKSATAKDLRLQTCLLGAITKAKFPMPEKEKGSVRVSYPFKFSSGSK